MRKRELTCSQNLKGFGISRTHGNNLVRRADVEDGKRPETTAAEAAELPEARKRSRGRRLGPSGDRSLAEHAPKMMYPSVVELAAQAIRVARSCRVMGFTQQAYYTWKTQTVSQRDWDDADLVKAARDVHANDPEFGYRLIHDRTSFSHGHVFGHIRVARLGGENDVASVIVKRRCRGKTPARTVSPAVHGP